MPIYLPLHDVTVSKVTMLTTPRFDLGKLMELRGDGNSSGEAPGGETSTEVEQAAGYEPRVQESV